MSRENPDRETSASSLLVWTIPLKASAEGPDSSDSGAGCGPVRTDRLLTFFFGLPAVYCFVKVRVF